MQQKQTLWFPSHVAFRFFPAQNDDDEEPPYISTSIIKWTFLHHLCEGWENRQVTLLPDLKFIGCLYVETRSGANKEKLRQINGKQKKFDLKMGFFNNDLNNDSLNRIR